MIVFFTASAVMLYTAVWYFPALLVTYGLASLIYDLDLVGHLLRLLRRSGTPIPEPAVGPQPETTHGPPELENCTHSTSHPVQHTVPDAAMPILPRANHQISTPHPPVSLRTGLTLILTFLIFLTLLLTLPSLLPSAPSVLLTLFTNLTLE